MLKGKVVYEGICFEATPKAAFVDKCMNDSVETKEVLFDSLPECDEDKEKVFDNVLRKPLFENQSEGLSAVDQFRLRPLLEMNHKKIHVESMEYLVYAIVENKKCREAMSEYLENDDSVFETFKRSKYKDSPFLYWFCQMDKLIAKAAIGLILQLRQDRGNGEKYRDFMDILYRGYQPLKNKIEKLHSFYGENFMDFISWEEDMVLNIARMVVQLVIAEELHIPIVKDYFFYVVLQMFPVYEKSFSELGEVEITNESKDYYKKMQKECGQLESYYRYYYQSDEGYRNLGEKKKKEIQNEIFSEDRSRTLMESLFSQYHLNTRMFYGMGLEKSEVEKIFTLFGEIKKEEYEEILLIATLCKYIDSLHRFCDENYERQVINNTSVNIA